MEIIKIVNAKVILPEGVRTDVSVLVGDGKILSVTQSAPDGDGKILSVTHDAPDGDGLIELDAAGNYLSPGFIDIHNHGRLYADVMDNSRESLSRIAKDLLSHGVTGFLITTQSAPHEHTLDVIRTSAEYIRDPDPDGAQPLGIYLEGPYFSESKKGAQQIPQYGGVDLRELEELIGAGEGLIRVVALAPELPNATQAIRMLTERGIVASAAHTIADYETAVGAIDAGVSLLTHTFNAMNPLGHREPGVPGACLTDRRVTCEAIVDGLHLHPATVKLIHIVKGSEGIVLISDSVAAAGIPDGVYDYMGMKVTVHKGAVRMPDGTLVGSTISLDTAVRNMSAFTGCSVSEAVTMAAFNPAHLLGFGVEKGAIEAGKDADLIIFDENVNIRSVIAGGKIVNIDR